MSQDQAGAWPHLPACLQSLNQWCIAGPDRAPYLPSSEGTIVNASPVIGPWLDFQTACNWANYLGVGIGYILTAADPYTCIDLDIKDSSSIKKNGSPYLPEEYTKPDTLLMYQDMVNSFDSYTELSASAKGLHIWVEGNIGKGGRRGGVEIYSQERFIVCTGNEISQVKYSQNEQGLIIPGIINNHQRGISARADLLAMLVKEIRTKSTPAFALIETTDEFLDKTIVETAMAASNAEKFNKLCAGDWSAMGYPSQSEADCALLSMFTFYTNSNEQCRRLFRTTQLGKRDKAAKNNRYLDATLRLIRGREAGEAQTVAIIKEQSKGLLDQITASAAPVAPEQIYLAENSERASSRVGLLSDMDWPPGKMGDLAQFIYYSSERPVKDVAIVAALGLMAGITGKAFVVNNTGLNLYITLVARSGIGKEAMHSGISLIVSKLQDTVPGLKKFVIDTDFVSGPALHKIFKDNQCFVNINGEWGHLLKVMARDENRTSPSSSLRKVMTHIYQKSSPDSVVGGLGYSDKEKSTETVSSVAYSMIGETTPETFYLSLTPSMMEDGFMSRFTVIEYQGDRPPSNENKIREMDEGLLENLKQIINQALLLNDSIKYSEVILDKTSKDEAHRFNVYCDGKINESMNESVRQMWNRAHLKVLRISAILAVTQNYINPTITMIELKWALDLVYNDILRMQKRLKSGDVGINDGARIEKLKSLIREYYNSSIKIGYNIPAEMKNAGIIPRRFLQTRISQLNSFILHPHGHVRAFSIALGTLIDDGYIIEVPTAEIVASYGNQGKCYRLTLSLD